MYVNYSAVTVAVVLGEESEKSICGSWYFTHSLLSWTAEAACHDILYWRQINRPIAIIGLLLLLITINYYYSFYLLLVRIPKLRMKIKDIAGISTCPESGQSMLIESF